MAGNANLSGYGSVWFEKTELVNMAAAVAALTIAFTIAMSVNFGGSLDDLSGLSFYGYALGVSFLAVITGFALHEFAHKVVAERNGARAEFRTYPLGLLLAVVFSFFGVVFAAPGAVYIDGDISKEQYGKISLAGPAANVVLGVLFIGLALISSGGLLGFALAWVGSVNFLLAAFNMLPIPPLDGYKVAKWNVPIYVLTFGIAAVLAGLVWFG
jgi:Zn-dependent protease